MTQDGSTGGRRRRHDATRTGAQSVLTSKCGFRFIPAGFSDVKPATVPI